MPFLVRQQTQRADPSASSMSNWRASFSGAAGRADGSWTNPAAGSSPESRISGAGPAGEGSGVSSRATRTCSTASRKGVSGPIDSVSVTSPAPVCRPIRWIGSRVYRSRRTASAASRVSVGVAGAKAPGACGAVRRPAGTPPLVGSVIRTSRTGADRLPRRSSCGMSAADALPPGIGEGTTTVTNDGIPVDGIVHGRMSEGTSTAPSPPADRFTNADCRRPDHQCLAPSTSITHVVGHWHGRAPQATASNPGPERDQP